MNFSKEWEERYKENTHMSIWPWSDLVSYVMQYAIPSKKKLKVLELGCGAGANIPFFLSLKYQYYGIDGSPTIVKKLWKRFPNLKKNIIMGDFIQNIPIQKKFDLIIDRAAVTCNSTKEIRKCIDNIYNKLKIEGKYIGIDWYSTASSEFEKGKVVDELSRKNYRNGPFANTGIVHFSNKEHIKELFKKFTISNLEHKIRIHEIPKTQNTFASWNFVAHKKR